MTTSDTYLADTNDNTYSGYYYINDGRTTYSNYIARNNKTFTVDVKVGKRLSKSICDKCKYECKKLSLEKCELMELE